MNPEKQPARSLREIEQEVLAEGREWTRQRQQQRLQQEADRHGEHFPPQRSPPASPPPSLDADAQRRRRR